MNSMKSVCKLAAAAVVMGVILNGKPASAATPYVMSTGNYSEGFQNIGTWANDFASGTGAAPWSSVATGAGSTIPDGAKVTTATTTFQSSSSSSTGIERGTNSGTAGVTNLIFLCSGTTDSSAAIAVDLNLNFTGRNAGTLSFDWATVFNSTGNRCSSIRVYTSTDGSTWTELAGTAVLNVANNVAASGSITTVALPSSFSGSSTARIRFYEYNGTGGTTGSRAKIAIDNVAVTSTGSLGVPPSISSITPSSIAANAGDAAAFTVSSTGDAATYFWYKETATSTNLIPTATTATLSLPSVLGADAAHYQVVLSNATPPQATSSVVSLTVVDPYLASQPVSQKRLLGSFVTFNVSVFGTQTLGYQWYVKPTTNSDFTGMSPVANGGTLSGALTNTLTITNLAWTDATNYFVVISNSVGSVTSSVVTLALGTVQVPLAFWDFNGNLKFTNPPPAQGIGTATFTNCTAFSNYNASALDYGDQNNGWGTATYPAAAVSNKTAGVCFNVNTLGAKNVTITYDTRATQTASKYERLQFTTNGTDFIDYPVSSGFIQNVNFESRAFSLAGFPGVANNANFAVRIVTEFESTARYGMTNNAQYTGNGGNYATSGTVTYDIVNISADGVTNNNTPPTISSFTNVITTDTEGSTVLHFTVGDAETAAGSLATSVASADQTVMPNGNCALGGSGASRTLTLTPTSGALGVAPILVTVMDGNGDITKTWFYVTVNPGNQPPTITGLVNTNMLGNVTNIFPFTIGDDQTPVGSLQLSATSGNTTLVSNNAAHLSFGGSGANRTLIVAPNTNQYGVTPITVTVNDGQKSTPLTFILVVRPNTITLMNEGFDYDTGGSLLAQSGGFWANHSGSPVGAMQVGSGVVTVTEDNAEDVNAPLIGQPYPASSKLVLYSSFTLNYSGLPGATNTYFAHFKDNSSSYYGRVYASTINAGDGFYRLGIGNQSTVSYPAQLTQDLSPGVNYTVVTRLVLSNGVSTIWINPTDESSPGMTDSTAAGAPSAITTYALRENAGEGTLNIDNLKVGLNFLSVITNIVDVPPQANPDTGSVMENGGSITLNPLANDVLNTLGGSLSLFSISPTNGTVVSGNQIVYTPTANFAGVTNIGYTITDGFGGTSSSTIAVTVTNNPPQANPDSYSVVENSVNNTFNPLTNDVVETSGGTLSLVSVSETDGNGSASVSGNQVLFTPTTGFAGTATIGYTVTDGIGGTSSSTITVTVAPPPTIVPTVPPAITGLVFTNGNIVITGTNAQATGVYYLLETTNASFPLSQWTPVSTNVVSTANGFTFIGTNVVVPGSAGQFYILSSTNNR